MYGRGRSGVFTPMTPAVQLGIHARELPDEQPAPVVTGEHRALVTERGDETGEADR